jgi:hypothetical protein
VKRIKKVRIERDALADIELTNVRLTESNEVLKDDVWELQHSIAERNETIRGLLAELAALQPEGDCQCFCCNCSGCLGKGDPEPSPVVEPPADPEPSPVVEPPADMLTKWSGLPPGCACSYAYNHALDRWQILTRSHCQLHRLQE